MNLKKSIVSIIGSGILAVGGIVGVSAQEAPVSPEQVPVDVVVGAPTGATISWTVTQTADWPAVESSLTDAQTVNGQMTVTVTDNRFNFRGWQLSISSKDFTPTTVGNPAIIPVENFALSSGAVTVLQGQAIPLPTANSFVLSEIDQVLFSAAQGTGSGRYSIPVTGSITIPANTPADTYASTIYVSLNAAP